jgi:hypothetical protein
MCSRKKFSFSICPHLDIVRPHHTLSDWTEIFFGDITYDYISEVVSSFFENLSFLFFYKKIHKGSVQNRFYWVSEPYKSGWNRQK